MRRLQDPCLGHMIHLNPELAKLVKNKRLRKVSLRGAEVTDVLLLVRCYEDASNKVAHEYTADLRLLIYMENATVFMLVV